jgi:hypothetical protein
MHAYPEELNIERKHRRKMKSLDSFDAQMSQVSLL